MRVWTLRSKIVDIEAVPFHSIDDIDNIKKFVPPAFLKIVGEREGAPSLAVFNTEEKEWIVVPFGHWIFKGINGEYYPCSPDVRQKKYDLLEETYYSKGAYLGGKL